ncbi:MAG: hypothetical protein HWE18_07870 [Gammaproteobacteria bacterium]|nr:hypothetical protein [Gammaproteobacteria bacterium]
MTRFLFNKMLVSMQDRYDYDVGYMQTMLQTDMKAFLKFMGFQIMSAHKGNLPTEVLFATRLRAILWDDCGPCTQLVVNMALESKVDSGLIQAIIQNQLDSLSDDITVVIRFTELVLAHNPEADELREEIIKRWGKTGLIAIGLNISASRVYPTLKYALGYGKACSRIKVEEKLVSPNEKVFT